VIHVGDVLHYPTTNIISSQPCRHTTARAAKAIPISEPPMRFPAFAVCFAGAFGVEVVVDAFGGRVAKGVVEGEDVSGAFVGAAEVVAAVVLDEGPGDVQQERYEAVVARTAVPE
jgi:hypothetical protein